MADVFITGSSDGLGLMTGRLLAEQGHRVVLHARNEARAEAARIALPHAEAVLIGDLSTLETMRDVAKQANRVGTVRCGDPQCRDRLPRAAPRRNRRWPVAALGRQRARALRADRPHAQARPAGLPEFGNAHRRDPGPRRPAVVRAALERQPGLCGHQVPRRAARLRGGAALARCAVECAHPGVGADPDGRAGCARRPRPGPPDPGLAGGERRSRRRG